MHYVVVRRRAKLETTKYHHILLELHLGDLLGVLIRDQFELEFDISSLLWGSGLVHFNSSWGT